MLPVPYRPEVARLLRQYVGARLDLYLAELDPDKLKNAIDKSERVQAVFQSAL